MRELYWETQCQLFELILKLVLSYCKSFEVILQPCLEVCWSPPVSPGSSGSEIIKLNQPGKWKPAWWFAKTSTPLWGRLIYCFFPQHGALKHIPFNSESWNVQLPSWKSVIKRHMNSDFQLGKSFGNLQPWFCKMHINAHIDLSDNWTWHSLQLHLISLYVISWTSGTGRSLWLKMK